MAGTSNSGGRNARIPRSLTRPGVEVDLAAVAAPAAGLETMDSRENPPAPGNAWLAELGAVDGDAARDAVGALADHHFLLQIAAEHIAELPGDPRPIAKRDAYAVQAQTHVLIARIYRALGFVADAATPMPRRAARDPSKPVESKLALQFERPTRTPA